MSADEPDSAPVTAAHVRAFLDWYRQRVTVSEIMLSTEWWHNALHTLTLGELRNGIRTFQRFSSPLRLSPTEFWQLCKGRQDEAAIARFRKMREIVLKNRRKENRDA